MEIPDSIHKELLAKNRLYFNSLRKQCNRCGGDGMISLDEDTCVKCDCTKKYYSNKKYLLSNLPLDYINITFDDIKKVYEQKCFSAYSGVLNSIEDIISRGFSFLFYRKNDRSWGITTAGVILAKRIVDIGRDLFCVDSLSLFDTFFSFGDNTEINSARIKEYGFYSTVPILLIDGFGNEGYRKEQKKGFIFNKLVSFLHLRKLNNRVTIICSDLTLSQIEDSYEPMLINFLKNEMVQFPISCNFDRNSGNATQKVEKMIPELKSLFETKNTKAGKLL